MRLLRLCSKKNKKGTVVGRVTAAPHAASCLLASCFPIYPFSLCPSLCVLCCVVVSFCFFLTWTVSRRLRCAALRQSLSGVIGDGTRTRRRTAHFTHSSNIALAHAAPIRLRCNCRNQTIHHAATSQTHAAAAAAAEPHRHRGRFRCPRPCRQQPNGSSGSSIRCRGAETENR